MSLEKDSSPFEEEFADNSDCLFRRQTERRERRETNSRERKRDRKHDMLFLRGCEITLAILFNRDESFPASNGCSTFQRNDIQA